MVNEAIVLAGGFGKRLRQVVRNVPKPMALVQGKPFLEYVLRFLERQGISKVVLSVGYLHEKIIDYFGKKYDKIEIEYSIEDKPLGTGGGIKKAMTLLSGDEAFILNGDTFFDVDLSAFFDFHHYSGSRSTIALKKLSRNDRYGSVSINLAGRITGFVEKESSLRAEQINGGIYLLEKKILEHANMPDVFSIEKDFFEKYYKKKLIFGYLSQGFFIDIGIPDDLKRAEQELVTFFK